MDANTKETIIGATVKIPNTNFITIADIDGKFEFKNLASGQYTLLITMVGYESKTINNIEVKAAQITQQDLSLKESTALLEAVNVTAVRDRGNEISMISELKEAQQIVVGVSAQQIAKTQDRDASSVVKRISGISIQDERFVIVRGLNERYNTVLLNDAITPSTETDTKAFSLDLIPSAAIDRMLVHKSASADMPGEFGGGIIKIYTKTTPDENSSKISIGTAYRGKSTFKTVSNHTGSKTDLLGFDNGTRNLPAQIPSTRRVLEGASSPEIINSFKNFNPYYTINQATAKPDFRISAGLNRNMKLKNGITLSTINNLSYSIANQLTQDIELNRYLFNRNAGTIASEKEISYNDEAFNQTVRAGLMTNWALSINPNHKIEFRNLFNQLSSKETVLRTGFNNNNIELSNGSMTYEQKSIYSGQLNGTHKFTDKHKFKWMGAFGNTYRKEPDNRRYTSSRSQGSSDDVFQINLQQSQSPTLQQSARFFSIMSENIIGSRLDYEYKTDIIGFKAGTYTENKNRDFAARWFGLVNPNNLPATTFQQSPNAFYQNLNLAPNGLFYNEGTGFEDSYKARSETYAGYFLTDINVKDKLSLNIGLRNEYNVQQLVSRKRGNGERVSVNKPLNMLLPSINISQKVNEKLVIKAAYGKTLNRPEFRELAPFPYYDFNFDVTRIGNIDLKTASIQNFDLGIQFSPSRDELITITVFYKKFENPIEARILNAGSGIAFGIGNAQEAFSRGLEIDARKSLKIIGLEKFMATINASWIHSNVNTGFSSIAGENRFLQGQSPYLINTGLYYNSDLIQANVLYNVIGSRVFLVGDGVVSPTVYEMPRNVIDLNLSKELKKKIEAKLSIQDILNQQFRYFNDTNNDKKITKKTDDIFRSYRRGTTVNLSLNFKI